MRSTREAAPLIARGEWAWAGGLSAVALLSSSIPVALGYWSQTPEEVFGGALIFRPDYEAHVTSIHAGLRGMWTYSLMHTAVPTTPAFIKTFYILVGQIGRLLPLSPPALFQAARLVCGLWALLTMYVFAAHFVRPVALRRTALAFYAFGSGVGWLLFLFRLEPTPGISPVDFWLSDLYGFLSLMQFPHFMAVTALLWSAALAMLRHWRDGRHRWLALAAAAVILAQAFQPFAPLIVDAALGLFAAGTWLAHRRILWPQVLSLGALAAAQLPLLAVQGAVVWTDPGWRSFAAQNVTASPPPVYYVLGLGVPGLLAAWGAWRVARRRWGEAQLLLAWVVAVAVLAYLPTNFQRRFTEGVFGPVAVLAAMGLGWGAWPALRSWNWFRQALARLRYPARRARGLFLMLAVVAAMPSSLYLAGGYSLLAVSRSPRLYDPADVVAAVDWLGGHSDWQAIVLSSEATGSLIGARIGHRVVLGHPIETVDYARVSEQVGRFYGDMPDAERRRFLVETGARHVFFGPYERDVGEFDPGGANYLAERFRSGDVAVYEVVQP